MKNCTFDSEKHEYAINGRRVFGVTEVLGLCGMIEDYSKWRGAEWKKGLGSAVHAATWLDDQNKLCYESLDPNILPYLKGWKKFRRDTGSKVIEGERQVFSERYRFAGTLDRIVDICGYVTILDIKCSSSPAAWWSLQTAGYEIAAFETLGIKSNRRYCVKLDGDGGYSVHIHSSKTDSNVFLASVVVAGWKQTNK